MRGKPAAAWSPAASASCLQATGRVRTRTAGPNEAATSAVSSAQPLATTIMSISPGSAPFMSCSRRRRITRPSLCAGITTVVTSHIMNDGGGRGQQLMMRQEIYFRDHRERSPEFSLFYPDIQAGLLRSIMRNPSAGGILAIRHGMLPYRLDAWYCRYGPARTADGGALRIGEPTCRPTPAKTPRQYLYRGVEGDRSASSQLLVTQL